MTQIRITSSKLELIAEIKDTPTARALFKILPCESSANSWGEEIYFSVPVKVELEADARQVVDPGTVCFWVEGNSVALPYGPTPISEGDECRLVSEVNILDKIKGDPRQLANIHQDDRISIQTV